MAQLYRGTICFKNSKKIREWVQAQGVTLVKRVSIETTSSGTRIATWDCTMDLLAYNKLEPHWQQFEWRLTFEEE